MEFEKLLRLMVEKGGSVHLHYNWCSTVHEGERSCSAGNQGAAFA